MFAFTVTLVSATCTYLTDARVPEYWYRESSHQYSAIARAKRQSRSACRRVFPGARVGRSNPVTVGVLGGLRARENRFSKLAVFDAGTGSSFSELGCVIGEDKVASFGWLVAGEAGFMLRLVGRFAVLIKLSEPPATCGGVLF
jgi:hypothetical protein